MLYAYGFTAAPATSAILIASKNQSVEIAAIIGGLGALVGDLFIFKLIRVSLKDEIEKLCKEKIIVRTKEKLPLFFKKYFLPIVACIIIASPLPDEIGVSLLSGATKISTKTFSFISYILNTIGILVILIIGKAL